MTTEPVGTGYTETGVASWYGEPFHGRLTASGERYDMEAMTAAHPWLPFGTRVRVENRRNGRTVEVRINDRGPFHGGRIIDLSRAAARRLDMIGPGTAPVRLVVLAMGAPPGCQELQLGAFRDPRNARTARKRAGDAGYETRLEAGEDGLIRVLAGPFRELSAARRASRRLGGFLRPCRGGSGGRNLGPLSEL